jgi:tRNA pseudouridine38-40 synthase
LHYEGRNFYGWQSQSNQRTVQDELAALLGRICGAASSKITAAGRTDRGVHATGQVASALIPERFDEAELLRALNALAPPDLWIASVERVDLSFHARYDAVSRTYTYRIGTMPESRSPFQAPRCWPLGHALDRKRVEEAASSLIGNHDFSAFAKAGQPERGVRCTVKSANWRFAEIGQCLREVDEIARLLRQEPGLRTSAPAPAQGLFLTRVDYSKDTKDNSD